MSDETKPSFYDPGTRDVQEAGRIADPLAAQELGNVEKTQGVDAALLREGELKRQHEDGKTDQEKEYIKLMDSLQQKYPGVFMDILDKKGRRILLFEPGKENLRNFRIDAQYLAYTEEGAMIFGSATGSLEIAFSKKGNVDFTPMLDLLANGGISEDKWNRQIETTVEIPLGTEGEKEVVTIIFQAMKLDLSKEDLLDRLRPLHISASNRVYGEKQQSVAEKIDAEKIVASL